MNDFNFDKINALFPWTKICTRYALNMYLICTYLRTEMKITIPPPELDWYMIINNDWILYSSE